NDINNKIETLSNNIIKNSNTKSIKINLINFKSFQLNDPESYKIVEENKQEEILNTTHINGHIGANAMVHAIHEKQLTWPNLKNDCIEWIKHCKICQRFNISKKGFHPLNPIHAKLPMDHIAIDLVGPLNTTNDSNVYVMVIVDVCTRFCWLRSLPDKSAITITKTLALLFCDISLPKIIQSDNGTEFV